MSIAAALPQQLVQLAVHILYPGLVAPDQHLAFDARIEAAVNPVHQ